MMQTIALNHHDQATRSKLSAALARQCQTASLNNGCGLMETKNNAPDLLIIDYADQKYSIPSVL
jgi:hypothetical protein